MISQAVEERMAAGRAARNRQSKECPLLINIKDFRLMPNVPRLGGQKEDKATGKVQILPHPDYRPYRGDPKATLEERRRLVETGTLASRPAVVDSNHVGPEAFGKIQVEDGAPFDVHKASREDLTAFAKRWFDADIDPDGKTHLMTLRAKVRDLARAAAGPEDLT